MTTPSSTPAPATRSGAAPTLDRATAGIVVADRYELISPVGHGGMGTVWRANDTLLRRDVAVKEVILPPTMPRNERDALIERTMREARAAAGLSHPSVVQVYDVVNDGGRPWIIMELLDARSLADMVIDDGPLPQREVAKIGIAMLGALEVAHAAGVLHRDVKPANVLVCTDGRCVLTDFGVARLPAESKLTTPGMVLGSPHFISPERAVGGDFGPPSDLFSLGVTLYTAVEGGPPFDRGDPFETMRAVVEEAPRPVRLAGSLEPVLWGLIEKEPARRWTTEQARTALRELLTGTLAPARTARLRASAAEAGVGEALTELRPLDAPAPTVVPVQGGPADDARPLRFDAPGEASNGGPSRVGGRAMLDPNEPWEEQLARLRAAGPTVAVDSPATPATITTPVDSPSRELAVPETQRLPESPPPAPAPSASPRKARAVEARVLPPRDGDSTPHHRRATTARHVGRRRAPNLIDTARDYVIDPAHRTRVLAGAGVLVVVVALALGLSLGLGGGPDAPAVITDTPAQLSETPLLPVQELTQGDLTINLPEGWQRTDSATDTGAAIDFADPAGGRSARVAIEPTSAAPLDLLTGAEAGLPASCPEPYARITLQEAQQRDQHGAQLEFTCGPVDAPTHSLWRVIVANGTAYHLRLTVPEAQLADSLVIWDELIRSFHLAGAPATPAA